MASEAKVQNDILLAVNQAGHRLWRSNAGKIKTDYGQWVKLFPKGFPDTVGYRKGDGKFIAIEVKNESGRLRSEQKQFRDFARTQPILYGVAHSVEEAFQIIEEDWAWRRMFIDFVILINLGIIMVM